MTIPWQTVGLALALFAAGCKTEHRLTVDPVPIHVTMDVNIKVQKDLEEFFDFEDMFEDVAAEDAAAEAEGIDEQP